MDNLKTSHSMHSQKIISKTARSVKGFALNLFDDSKSSNGKTLLPCKPYTLKEIEAKVKDRALRRLRKNENLDLSIDSTYSINALNSRL